MEQETKILVKKVSISSQKLTQIDESLLAYLKKTVEGRCDILGFIVEVSEIVSRSPGILDDNNFSGEVNFDVWFKAKVVNIRSGDILLGCNITLVAVPGIFLETNGFIKIFVNSKYLPSDFMKKYKANQKVNIYVLESRCELTRTQIDVLGREHYYSEISFANRTIKLNQTRIDDLKKIIVPVTRDDKETIENLRELGYLPEISAAKAKIDEIPAEIWKFYRSLLNPLELVSSPSRYSTFRIGPKIGKVPVPSRAYYKLWEIINHFHVVSTTKEPVLVVNLCEAPGGFVKALIDYRESHKVGKEDKYFVITLKGPGTLQFSKDLAKAYSKQITMSLPDCDCDLTKIVTIKGCLKAIGKGKANIITADGGIRTTELDFEEEKETSLLKLSELVCALSLQKLGGVFIWKLFDTCTRLSADLLYVLNGFYERIDMYKPETSRPANSERYVIASGFKGMTAEDLKVLLTVVEQSKKYVVSLVSEKGHKTAGYQLLMDELKVFNERLMLNQYRKIKEIIDMIKFQDVKIMDARELEEYQSRQKIMAQNWAKKNDL